METKQLDWYQELMYRNVCEAYSDMRAYFLTRKFFNKNEIEFLKVQREYFNVCSKGLRSPNSKFDVPSYLKKEIEVMEGNLMRYFAQFEKQEVA